MSITIDADVIPTCIKTCCREWVCPLGAGGGTCGLCGEVPTFTRHLGEDQWVRPRPPVRPEGL